MVCCFNAAVDDIDHRPLIVLFDQVDEAVMAAGAFRHHHLVADFHRGSDFLYSNIVEIDIFPAGKKARQPFSGVLQTVDREFDDLLSARRHAPHRCCRY